MGRWAPDGRQRLQNAGIELLRERGYDAVSVADIAERAGLTKRTFFNHFDDKRDLLFAGAQDLEDAVVRFVESAGPELPAFETALWAFSEACVGLAPHVPFARERRELIDSSQALQERDLVKAALLIAAVEAALCRRGIPARHARLATVAAHEVFRTAYESWSMTPDADCRELMSTTARELREILSTPSPA